MFSFPWDVICQLYSAVSSQGCQTFLDILGKPFTSSSQAVLHPYPAACSFVLVMVQDDLQVAAGPAKAELTEKLFTQQTSPACSVLLWVSVGADGCLCMGRAGQSVLWLGNVLMKDFCQPISTPPSSLPELMVPTLLETLLLWEHFHTEQSLFF